MRHSTIISFMNVHDVLPLSGRAFFTAKITTSSRFPVWQEDFIL
ncbi:hypothetical protein HMPREF9436_00544 [Faecalibacterium cf. prausnitzii KLE1255]|uniref:Uncharacterized protein n=1 Tax=Faecalibacterium cf. prausnitzii KLE1255 TaxID=748224 RepID=E2ZFW1_9FIRM|nr:hypothetical protein HMPREF9436_00544 [Faecalibacterium cf. prausnitzii KLE1255]